MSGPIAFRFNDDAVADEFQEYQENLDGDPSQSDVARELIDAGLDAEHRDAYDHIGADEQLREAVADVRNVEETDEEAIRRVLREGLKSLQPTTPSLWGRFVTGVGGATIAAGAVLLVIYAGLVGAFLAVVGYAILFAFGEKLARVVASFQATVASLLADEAERNRSR